MSDITMSEVTSFLEVPEGFDVRVKINQKNFNLGYVDRIYATSDNYIVWQDEEERIWFETDDRDVIKQEDFHKFWNRYQLTRCRSMQNLDKDSKASYLSMQSSAISSALEGQFMAAAESLESAAAFITTANERVSRRRYTVGALLLFFIFLILSYSLRNCIEGSSQIFFILEKSTLGGALGATLSALASRKGRLGFDPNASRLEGIFNGGIRVFYGVMSAFVVVTVAQSGILSSPLMNQGNEGLSMLVIAMAGGFAERWAADLIQRFQTDADKDVEKIKSE